MQEDVRRSIICENSHGKKIYLYFRLSLLFLGFWPRPRLIMEVTRITVWPVRDARVVVRLLAELTSPAAQLTQTQVSAVLRLRRLSQR